METRLLIGGELVAGDGPALDVEDPAHEQTLATLNTASPEQVDAAIAAAREASGDWGRLPEKLFVVHQFTKDMIKGKERVKRRPGLAITMNVDGFGDRPNKLAKYREFTSEAVRFHDGFKLFYREDTNLMSAGAVLDLRPPPDRVVYE